MSKKKQGFVYGALILMLSNIIVKVVGALFKIPLANVIGDTAMGYFNAAYSIYSMCFLISTAGLPVAISRMIAASRARKRGKEVDAIYRISLLIFIVIGLIGTAGLFFGADAIAAVQGEKELAVCIKTISPIMFFICLVSSIRGYFQGCQNMFPTAISQVIEVMGNLCLGLTAGILANRNGASRATVAAFALAGVTLGVVLSAVYMVFAKWIGDRDRNVEDDIDPTCRSKKSLAKELVLIAIPITVSSSILSLTSVIDSMLATSRLSEIVGISYFPVEPETSVAMTLYGAYTAKAVTLFNLPPAVIYPFVISLIPAISSADATKDRTTLKKTMDFTFRIVSVICLPCAVGLAVMAKPIINLLFSNEAVYKTAEGITLFSNDVAAPLLAILAAAILFSGLISVSGAMLQASGFAHLSIISTCCGVTAKAVATWFLVGLPSVGYYGIPLSTLLCYLIMFCFNMYFLFSRMHYRLSFRSILLRPLLAAAFCGITAGAAYFAVKALLPDSLATVGGIGVAAIVYVFALFRLRGFEKDDVLMLPKGEKILRLLTKLRLIRA